MTKNSENNEMFLNAKKRALNWIENTYFSKESRYEIQKLLDEDNQKEITERFYKDLEFGTGGMRSILGEGVNRINTYTIRKATWALCQEVLKENPQSPSICISYDSRRRSFELAQNAAEVMAAYGIRAYLFSRLNPVAMLSFAVRLKKASAGVMVTASHNPPEYNGFKVFWNDGSQVTPPNDKNIIDHYNGLTHFENIQFMPFQEALHKGRIEWMNEDVEDEYFKAVLPTFPRLSMCREEGKKLKIVYTPIHGAGLIPCRRLLETMGLTDIHVVKEQELPDGNFPTVKSPNPENPSALKLAVDLMLETKADLAMGSDPDTDRLGVALFHENKVHYLTGNQIGILKLHYILKEKKERGFDFSNSYFVKTIVTTPLQDTIAKSFGVETFNTLTGFKWICGKMNEVEKKSPHKIFLFATEESFGYLSHPHARDKDGITSVGLMAEIALYYKLQGKNLLQAIDDIYREYGLSHETLLSLDYFGIEGALKIKRIMKYFREEVTATFSDLKILKKIDYLSPTTGLPASDVIGLTLDQETLVYLRPSGTEPKIKFYIMIEEKTGDLETKKANAEKKTVKILEYLNSVCANL